MKRLIFSLLLSTTVFTSQPLLAMEVEQEEMTLDLSKRRLEVFPPEIITLQNLTYLNLDTNYLSNLPDDIGNLQSLTDLSLNMNKLTKLPHTIEKLTNLEQLNLSNNRLTALPPKLCDLPKLKHLEVNNNQLTTLPLNIYKPREVGCAMQKPLKGNEGIWLKNLYKSPYKLKVDDGNGVRRDYAPALDQSFFFRERIGPNCPTKEREEREAYYIKSYARANLFFDFYYKLDNINQNQKTLPHVLRFFTRQVCNDHLPTDLIDVIHHQQLDHPIFINYLYGIESPEFKGNWQGLSKKFLDDFFAS